LASGKITGWEWFWHVFGGAVGVGVVYGWNYVRMRYHKEQQQAFVIYEKARPVNKAECVYQMAPTGIPSSALSISFANRGAYY
jgi:hypothetical protein